ncbi:MAG: methyltransferase domain-containing protein [Verrucomicrobiales bacterium]|nr:methyltransferase domain-containing protein [Verrucomicrobiales bacterium]
MSEKTGRTVASEAELPKDLYFGDSYFEKAQLHSFVMQLHHIYKLRPKRILEIGKGNGFVSDFLKKAGFDVVTFDINESLEPDIVGSVTDLDRYVDPGGFDLVVCAEVLEHLPFDLFPGVVHQIAKATRSKAFVTIPRAQRILIDFQCRLRLPKIGVKEFGCFLSRRGRAIWEGHHWEIDCSEECREREIRKHFLRFFEIGSFEREKGNPYHMFATLQVRPDVPEEFTPAAGA